ncbi:hypothetical protein E4U59_000730 [Claviceps monticola]|nr:hypothetical protein E4U59_000730 [Claviceps monticola]
MKLMNTSSTLHFTVHRINITSRYYHQSTSNSIPSFSSTMLAPTGNHLLHQQISPPFVQPRALKAHPFFRPTSSRVSARSRQSPLPPLKPITKYQQALTRLLSPDLFTHIYTRA